MDGVPLRPDRRDLIWATVPPVRRCNGRPQKNTMTIGADGEVMHSLHADKSGTVTVNLLKDLADKQKLSLAYNAQESVLGYLGKQRHCDPQQGERRHHHGAQRGVPETTG